MVVEMNTLNRLYKLKDLTIESKALFTYLFMYYDPTDKLIHSPSLNKLCEDLNISRSRYYVHRKHLVERGILIVTNRGEFNTTIYKVGKIK